MMAARPHLPGCVLNPEHTGECTTVPELVELPGESRKSGGLQEVLVVSSDPPPLHRRAGDHIRLRDQDWRSQFVVGFKWCLAPVVRDWSGLSLVRLIAILTALGTNDLAHDWIQAMKAKGEIGFAFALFVLGGWFLAAILALGEKYIDKLITIVGAKLGVALVNAPVPSLLTEKKP